MEAPSERARAALRRYHDAAALTPAARDRIWHDLEASLASGATIDDAPPARPRRRARVAIAAVITTLAAAMTIAVCDQRMRPGEAARRGDGAAIYAATPGESQATSRRAPGPETVPAPITGPPPPPTRPRRAASGAEDLAAEVALLRRARAALDDGDPDAALRILGEHAREFPGGQMQEDRQRLRVEALCALGRGEQARAEADAFLQQYPGSTHGARVRNLCREDRPTP